MILQLQPSIYKGNRTFIPPPPPPPPPPRARALECFKFHIPVALVALWLARTQPTYASQSCWLHNVDPGSGREAPGMKGLNGKNQKVEKGQATVASSSSKTPGTRQRYTRDAKAIRLARSPQVLKLSPF